MTAWTPRPTARKPPRFIDLLLCRTGALVGLVLAVVALQRGARDLWFVHERARWPTVIGHVLSSGLQKSASWLEAHAERPAVLCSYVVDGKEQQRWCEVEISGPRAAWWDNVDREYPAGAEIEVHYDPADPSRSLLDPALSVDDLAALGVGVGLLYATLMLWFAAAAMAEARNAKSVARFEARVKAAEQELARDAGGFARRLVRSARLGQAYVMLLVGVLAGLVVALLWLWFARGYSWWFVRFYAPPLLALIAVLRSFARRSKEEPRPATDLKSLPQLKAIVDECSAKLGASPLEQVRITGDLDVSMAITARFGWLGGLQRDLELGLPALHVLSVASFTAIVARELSRRADRGERAHGWLHDLHDVWSRMILRLERESPWAPLLLVPFFPWWWPRFAARAIVFARHGELEADRLAAATTSASALGDALCELKLRARFLDQHYWPEIDRRAKSGPVSELAPVTNMLPALSASRDSARDAKWLEEEMARSTAVGDDEPCLRDRLASLNEPARVPPAPASSAADALLRKQSPRFAAAADREWVAAVKREAARRQRNRPTSPAAPRD